MDALGMSVCLGWVCEGSVYVCFWCVCLDLGMSLCICGWI